MMLSGLLWFDDDTRRPLPQKIAQAAIRYRERVGYIPTLVEVNPQQATITTLVVTPEIADDLLARTGKRDGKRGAKAKGAASVAPAKGRGARKAAVVTAPSTPANAPTVRVEPNPTLRPNYFLVGIAAGEQPIRAPEYIADDEDLAPAATADHASAASTSRPRARRAKMETPSGATTAAPDASATPPARVAPQAAGRPAIAPRKPTAAADTSSRVATRATHATHATHATERDHHTSKPSPTTAAPKPLAAPTTQATPTIQPAQPAPKRVAKRAPKREVERASAPSITPVPEPTMTPMRRRSARSTPISPASAATLPTPQAWVAPVAATPMRTSTAAIAPNERATPQIKARRVAHTAAQATPTLDAPLAAEAPTQAKATRTRKAAAPKQPMTPPVAPTPPASQTASPTTKRAARTASQRQATPTTPAPPANALAETMVPTRKRRVGKVTQAAPDVPMLQPRLQAPRQLVPATTPTRRTTRRSAATSESITQIALPFGAVEAPPATLAKQPIARSTRSTRPTKITAPTANHTSDHTGSTKTTQPAEALASVIPPLKSGARKATRPAKPVSSVA